MSLVILVVYLFLQSWRTTLIPAVAVPVSLIGALAGMQALGFSINTLTLFGMVLAIGIVVDDAIVVVENVERHMKEECCSSKEAAKRAMAEVTAPIIAIVLVLCAVFVPVGFLGGITGQLYKQFAITIAISVTISGFVALTLSPALCALVLKPGGEEVQRKGFFPLFNKLFDWTRDRYTAVAAQVIKRAALALAVFGVVIALGTTLLRVIPSGFLPEEDQGYLITVVQLPDGASLQRTTEVMSKLEKYFLSIPVIHSTDALVGQNFVFNTRGPNSATLFTPLHLWDKRKRPDQHVKAIIGSAFREFLKIPEAFILAFNAPSIRGLGATGGRAVPDESRRSHQDLRARPERAGHVHDPAQYRGHDGIHQRAGPGDALQRIQYGLRAGSGGSRRELGSGSRRAGTSGEGGAHPQGLWARLERDFLPGTECRREVGCGVRVRSSHGLSGAGRPVRELDGALCRDSGRAFRRLRGLVRRMAPGDDQRHLLPDRAGHSDRAFRQERDPPRGFCQSSLPRWHVGHRGGHRGGEDSLPADHHDLNGVHPGGDASGHR